MSGAFFGLWQAHQQPANPADLVAMDQALAHWGPDAAGMHCQGPIGLGARLLRVTPEDEYEHLPLIDGPHCLVARVRLDNRRDLCARLGLRNTPQLPDCRLILEAYRHYGQDCVQYLMGDWSFALWDATTQTLMVARDASGNTGVFYSWDGRRLVFTNGLKGILALSGLAAHIEPIQLASVLTMFLDPEVADATLYKGVKKLLPGCFLLARDGRMEIRRWWHPEMLEPKHYQRVEDCYDEFIALYDEVVGECLRIGQGSVAATLSGGLDSGSVLAFAAPRLQQRGQMMTAYVHAPFYEPTLAGSSRTGDELALARLTAEQVGNTRVVPVRSEDKTLLWGMQQALDAHHMPMFAATNFFWIFDILQKARHQGARVLLTGQMGNATVSYAGHGNLWPGLRQGHLLSVVQALLNEESGLWLALKRRLVYPMVWPALSKWRHWRADGPQPWAAYSYIHPDWAARLQLRQRMQESGVILPFMKMSTDSERLFRLGLLGGDFAGTTWMELGAAHGLDVRDPTRDRRIVEFCWRAPDDAFWSKGKMRGLIRQGVKGRLPDSVLNCRAKGLQGADALARFKIEAEDMLRLLADAEKQGFDQWLDVIRMRRDLNALAAGHNLDIKAMQGLGRAVQSADFLFKTPYIGL